MPLLNNGSDKSVAIALEYKRIHPGLSLHVVERTFSPDEAHVGIERRILINAACARLETLDSVECRAIMCTDADTLVAPSFDCCESLFA